MILVNESKRVLVLSAPGYQDLYIRKSEVFSFDNGLYNVFENSIKALMSINDKIKIYTNEDWSKIKTKETPVKEKVEDKPEVNEDEEAKKKALSEYKSAKKAYDTMPEDAHHKTKFAIEKRLSRAKKRLESFN